MLLRGLDVPLLPLLGVAAEQGHRGEGGTCLVGDSHLQPNAFVLLQAANDLKEVAGLGVA